MTRPEAIEFLKWLREQTDICYACHDCITTDKCELQAVIDLLEREQEDDDRLDALRFATMELVKKAWNESNRIPEGERMTGSEYQKLAMRTNDGFSKNRLMDAIGEGEYHDIDVASLLMGCMGLAGESGELLDLIKKWVFHSKPLDEEHAKKELGDVMWYVAEIAYSMGWDLDEIMTMNIDKLKARYPEGFDTERSNHRSEEDV